MAPRKSKISFGKKRKIKSKKSQISKCKSTKRKYNKPVPLKKRQVKKINTCNLNDREVENSQDFYSQGEARSFSDFPLEELYHDNRGALSSSDLSDEDDCEFDSNQKFLRRKPTSSNESLVQKYIDSGMNHVASFIVESAIRFGQEQGVVIPEKGSKNVYEFVSPYSEDKDKKIRFRIPSKIFGYEEAKKAMWKRRKQKKPLHLAKSVNINFFPNNSSESDLEKTQKKVLKRRKKKAKITDPKSFVNSSTSSSSNIT